jgi:probable rRNA maturation factor
MEPGSRRPGLRAGISVVVAERGWRAAIPRAERLAAEAVRAALAESGERGSVTVLLDGDRGLKALNGRHRGKAKPTNVLSFPAGAPGWLGDVALGLGVVRREARAARRRVADHTAHLVVHGTLHLIGHDHLRAGEARRMERAEARAMRRLGRPNPWRGVT